MTQIKGDSGAGPQLQHYGIKGMKWGTRRGGLGSRFKGMLSDQNHNQTAILKRRASGHAKGLDEKLASGISRVTSVTKKRFDEKNKTKLHKLANQKKRLDTGHLKARDILQGIGHLSSSQVAAADLVISRRDNKGS